MRTGMSLRRSIRDGDGDGAREDATAESPRPDGARRASQRLAPTSATAPPGGLALSRNASAAVSVTPTAEPRVESPAPRPVCGLPAGRRRAAAPDTPAGGNARGGRAPR